MRAWNMVTGLYIHTIGITRAETKITLGRLVYNMHRLIFHERGDDGMSAPEITGMPAPT